MSHQSLRRYRAERLLRGDFAARRSKVLAIVGSQLRAKSVVLDPADLEACYAMAWQGLYSIVFEGEQVENPTAWLVVVTFRRAIDESRLLARHVGVVDSERVVAFEPDLAGELDDRAKLRQVLEGLRSRLTGRECEAASLCYLQGLSRAEAAARMGISQARMRKLMEGAGPSRPGVAGKVAELVGIIRDGGWCEQQSSLMRAYAFGVLDPDGERHALAAAHCRECPSCRLHVATLRGLATVLPPLPLQLLLGAAAGGTGAAGAGAGAGAGAEVGTGAGVRAGVEAGTGAGVRAGAGTGAAGAGIGGRVAAGWSGIAGSLTAKLAATAVVVLGAGYAVLGSSSPSHARGGPSVQRLSGGPPTAVSGSPLTSPLPVRFRPNRAKRSAQAAVPRHARARTGTSPVRAGPTHEFLPERARPEAPAVAPSQAPPQRPTSAAGEFGIE